MPYIGTQPKDVRSFGRAQFDFTATQGQTAFSGQDDDGKYLGFTEGQVQVYVNGILMDASDYTASAEGNTITLASAANLNDIITVVALQTDIPNSDYVPISGGTFSGSMNFSGDLTVGATAIHVDQTNKQLGIGASSIPSGYQLNVYATGANSYVKLSNSTIGNTANDGLDIISGTDGIGYFWNRENAEIRLGTDDTERMRIDSAGRVTMPYQPCFHAYASAGGNNTVAGGTVPTSWNADTNVGSHFSNGRFTAPIAGTYRFYFGILSGNTNQYGLCKFIKNGGDISTNAGYSQHRNYGTANDNTLTREVIAPLAASDYVELFIHPSHLSFYWQAGYSYFGGHLIG